MAEIKNTLKKMLELLNIGQEEDLVEDIVIMLTRAHANECAKSEDSCIKTYYGEEGEPEDAWPNVVKRLDELAQQTDISWGSVIHKVVLNTGYINRDYDISEAEALLGFDYFRRSAEGESTGLFEEFKIKAEEQGLNFYNVIAAEQALRTPLFVREM